MVFLTKIKPQLKDRSRYSFNRQSINLFLVSPYLKRWEQQGTITLFKIDVQKYSISIKKASKVKQPLTTQQATNR
jgi:hypothetical protein